MESVATFLFKYSPHRIDEFYDTRCDYDPVNKRFAILSADAGSPFTGDGAFRLRANGLAPVSTRTPGGDVVVGE